MEAKVSSSVVGVDVVAGFDAGVGVSVGGFIIHLIIHAFNLYFLFKKVLVLKRS